jgi:hypothetical protein
MHKPATPESAQVDNKKSIFRNPPKIQPGQHTIFSLKRRTKMPAPLLNGNATTSGRFGLIVSRLPEGCSYIKRALHRLRSGLEGSVSDVRGEVSICDAATIFRAVQCARHLMLCSRWLHVENSLTIDQRISLSRDVASGAEKLDKAIRSLAIQDVDKWSRLFDELQDEPEAVPQLPVQRRHVPPAAEVTPEGIVVVDSDAPDPSPLPAVFDGLFDDSPVALAVELEGGSAVPGWSSPQRSEAQSVAPEPVPVPATPPAPPAPRIPEWWE